MIRTQTSLYPLLSMAQEPVCQKRHLRRPEIVLHGGQHWLAPVFGQLKQFARRGIPRGPDEVGGG